MINKTSLIVKDVPSCVVCNRQNTYSEATILKITPAMVQYKCTVHGKITILHFDMNYDDTNCLFKLESMKGT